MNFHTEQRNHITILRPLVDRLDSHNSESFKHAVQKVFEEGQKEVLVDLQEVIFIDTTALGAFVSGYKQGLIHKGNFKLCCLQHQVKSLVVLTRLHRVFEIYPSAAQAVDCWS